MILYVLECHDKDAHAGTVLRWKSAERDAPCPVCEGESFVRGLEDRPALVDV